MTGAGRGRIVTVTGGASADERVVTGANARTGPETTGAEASTDESADAAASTRRSSSERSYVGEPVPRTEDRRILTGEAEYVHDVAPEGCLHAALVRSPMAHADIEAIRTDAAEGHPACRLVLTGRDVAASYNPMPCGINGFEEWPLAVERARYVGEPVACVVATDRYAAEDVADLVEVEYDRRPPVVDPDEARGDDVLVHEDAGTNVADHDRYEFGDVDGAFAAADRVIERTYSWARLAGLPLETAGAVATYDESTDSFDVYSNMQLHTHPGRNSISHTLGYDPDDVTLHCPADIGGSFGTKITSVQRYCCLAAMASRALERPVKYVEDRTENLEGGDVHGSDRTYDVRLAVDDDGAVRGLDVRFVDDFGAFPRFSVHSVIKPLAAVTGPYDVEHVRYEYDLVLTNKPCQAVYRGYGMPQHTYALEMLVDDAARELDIDPHEFRRRNLVTPDQMPHQIPSKNVYDSGDYPAALAEINEIVDENERCEGGLLDPDVVERRRAEGKYRGVRPSVFLEPGTGGQDWPDRMRTDEHERGYSLADVDELPEHLRAAVEPDGTLSVGLGTDSAGQGHQTLVAQLLADDLGIPIEDVDVRYLSSAEVDREMGSAASRMTVMLSGAAAGLCQALAASLERLAAEEWGCRRDAVSYSAGAVRHDDGRELDLAALASADERREESYTAITHEYDYPANGRPEFEDAYLARLPIFATTAFTADAPIVEVDVETGAVEILRYYALHDCGTVVNPTMLDGQCHGAIAHGIGAALLEEFVYDDAGQPQSITLFDYHLPSIENVPEIELRHSVTPSPFTENGAKGAAEGGTIAAPAAIAIAVNAALSPLDASTRRIPITPAHVRSRLRDAGEGDDPP